MLSYEYSKLPIFSAAVILFCATDILRLFCELTFGGRQGSPPRNIEIFISLTIKSIDYWILLKHSL
jgi:hypothetical protein